MKKWLSEELIPVDCDICGTTEKSSKFVRADGMTVAECSNCGLAYLTPRPRTEFISKLYGSDYFNGAAAARGEGGLRCDVHFYGNASADAQPKQPRAIEIVKEQLGGFRDKDLLEIGCATGDFLFEAKTAGARTKGVELSDFAAQIARKRDLDVQTGTVEDIDAKNNRFDLVMAFEVIEHVPSPTQFLSKIAQLVRPGGVFMVSTPNYACAKRFGSAWFGFNASFEHIYYFSLQVLKKMAEHAGFKLEYWESSIKLGGPDYSSNPLRLQTERARNLLFFIKETGLYRTIKALLNRSSGFYPYGAGHTMVAVFRKKTELEISDEC